MIDINTILPLISQIFQGSSGTMSKQAILAKVTQSDGLKTALSLFQQLAEKQDYTPDSLKQELQKLTQNLAGSLGGSLVDKVKGKFGF